MYVNLDALAGAESAQPVLQPGVVETAPALSQSPIPATLLPDPGANLDSSEAEMDRAKEILARDRALAIRELHAELFRAYRKEVDRYRIDEESKLAKQTSEAYAEAQAKAYELLNSEAEKRGVRLNRLALFVGFPVPLVAIWPAIPADRKWERRWREEALRLVAELGADEQAYRAKIDALFASAEQAFSDRRTALQLEVSRRLEAADSRATEEAERAFQASATKGRSFFVEKREPDLVPDPGTGGLSMDRGGSFGLVPAPAVPMPPLDAKKALLQEARVWAGQQGYKLVLDPSHGRDATKEFAAWKHTRHPGL